MSGSGLLLLIPSDMPPSLASGSSIIVFCPDHRHRHWPSPWTKGLGTPSRNPFHAGHGFRGYAGSLLLRPVRLLAPLYGSDRSPGHRGLLLPGFRRVGHPSRGWVWLRQWLDSSVGGTLTRWNSS